MPIVRALIFVSGVALAAGTLLSAMHTFVLPRNVQDRLTRVVFLVMWQFFRLRLRAERNYDRRDQIMALYAPLSLLSLPPVWLALVLLGYTGIYWALGAPSWYDAFRLSGSSLLTLGFAGADGLHLLIVAFSEATLGLILVALLIAYLPTMYTAFSRRETAVTLLDVRAGTPPSAVEMLKRYQRLHGLDRLSDVWEQWEVWFAEVEETHTSLAPLAFFRSPQPPRSWVTASGAVLDAASLTLSTVDIPFEPRAALCIRAGYLALRHVATFFQIPYKPDATRDDPISVTREEYDAACDELAAEGVPLQADREQAWLDFKGWRVNYDVVLLALAALTLAPSAPWSGDRPYWPNRPWLRGE